MGAWGMIYLKQKHKKDLALVRNPSLSGEKQAKQQPSRTSPHFPGQSPGIESRIS
jgi:hypothetical protein